MSTNGADAPPKEIEIFGVTRQDYNYWKHHPVSQLFLRYLRDKRDFIQNFAVDRWLAGQMDLQEDNTMRGQIIELAELSDTPFECIVSFYDEELSGTEAAQDSTR